MKRAVLLSLVFWVLPFMLLSQSFYAKAFDGFDRFYRLGAVASMVQHFHIDAYQRFFESEYLRIIDENYGLFFSDTTINEFTSCTLREIYKDFNIAQMMKLAPEPFVDDEPVMVIQLMGRRAFRVCRDEVL